jgi:hypothetical protein
MVDVPPVQDALVNLFMTLYAVSEGSKRGEIDGRVKLMKLLQRIEEELTKKGMRGPSFVFYKWEHGAWSPEAQFDIGLLKDKGFISENEELHQITVTSTGQDVVDKSRFAIQKNRAMFDIINRVLASHVQYKSWELRAITYATPSLYGEKKRIGEIEKGKIVLSPLTHESASKAFVIDDKWQDMLSDLFSESLHELIEQTPEKPNPKDYISLSTLRSKHGLL